MLQTAPWLSLDNVTDFSFGTVSFAGGSTTAAISLAGLAMADNANGAIGFPSPQYTPVG